MRRRNLVLSGLGVATLMFSSGCDSTVGLDPTRTSFTKVIVPGACKAQDDLGQIDFSVMLLDGTRALLPDTRLNGEFAPVGELLEFDDFRFSLAPNDAGSGFAQAAVALGPDAMPRGVDLNPIGLEFAYSGGEDRRRDPRLVVMMLDHSGSLAGIDPFTGDYDPGKASDPNEQRISFFQQLVSTLPDDYLLSLVSFKEGLANITPDLSTPIRNKSVILEGLNELQFDQRGTTPLTRALNDTRNRVIEPNGNMNPVVVLFTDGVEAGDPSDAGGQFEEAVAGYADRAAGAIPVIVIHLQRADHPDIPAEQRGRNAKLAELACRTGGEYIFLPNADEFTTNNNLQPAVSNRIVGVWRLAAESTLSNAEFEPGGWLLSTQVEVTLAGRSLATPLQRARESSDEFTDTRVWFSKE